MNPIIYNHIKSMFHESRNPRIEMVDGKPGFFTFAGEFIPSFNSESDALREIANPPDYQPEDSLGLGHFNQ